MPAAADLASSASDAPAPAARVPAGAGREQAGGGAGDPVPTLGVEQHRTAVARGGILRDHVGIVGTPATLPYSESALRFFERYDFAKPAIEIHPEREAVALFCDITHSPRSDVLVTFTRMGSDASGFCASERPRTIPSLRAEIVELEVGYEAAVVARSVLYGSVALPARALFLALAREVPDPRVVPNPRLVPELVANPYRAWYEIDPLLPYDRIELIGPSPDSAAAKSSLGIIMELGCAAMPSMVLKDRNPSRYAEICRTVRSDGVYTQIPGANDLIARLETYPTVFGVLSYDTFARNRAKLAAAVIDGVAPTRETLADGQYPAARTLYVYVNEARARAAPGFRELVETYLLLPQIARVLVPLDETKRREMQTRAADLGGEK
jgi:phosphate transport system substrate-binding protein